jgi:hypothetical protein
MYPHEPPLGNLDKGRFYTAVADPPLASFA